MAPYLLLVLIVVCAILDIKYRKIPNIILIPAWVFSVIWSLLHHSTSNMLVIIANTILVLVIFGHGFYKGYMGGADLKLMFVIACWLSIQDQVYFILLTLLSGAIMSLYQMARQIIKDKEILIHLLNNKTIMGLFSVIQKLKPKTIPYAVSIAIGYVGLLLIQNGR